MLLCNLVPRFRCYQHWQVMERGQHWSYVLPVLCLLQLQLSDYNNQSCKMHDSTSLLTCMSFELYHFRNF